MNTPSDHEHHSLPRQFFEELKRRRVIRVVTVYIFVLWPVIQIADILTPAIGVPGTAMRYMLIAFVAGLPVVLILSWLYDLNKGGIVRTSATGGKRGQALIGRSAEIAVIGVLLGAIVILFGLQSTVSIEDPAATSVTENTGVRAIAVLPFVSFSSKPEDEQFSDGLTEELLNVLSQIKQLRVTARTTSFAYKGVNRNVQEIGRELNVDTILEGSVRRNDVDNTIRITAQIIETSTGTHIWSDTFDREFRDIFKIQDEIAAAVVEQLHLALEEEESLRIVARDSASAEAMMAFSKGSTALARRTLDSLTEAEGFFKQAIAEDPNYASAYAELANAHTLQAAIAPEQLERQLTLAQLQVDKSLELDPRNGAAWAAQGLIYMSRPDRHDDARQALQKAMELNPSLAMAQMWYGSLMTDQNERLRYHTLAFELDPRSPVAGYNLADDLLNMGREAEAMVVFGKIVEADPNYPNAYRLIARINEFRGRLSEAIRAYEKVYSMQPSGDVAARLAGLWVDIGDFKRADEWMALAEQNLSADKMAEFQWIQLGSYVARGNREVAEAMMLPMLRNPANTAQELLNAARAGYFLGDYEAAVAAYERAQSGQFEGWAAMMINSADMEIMIAYAYRKLGRDAEAQALLTHQETELDKLMQDGTRAGPDLWYESARIDAIRGDHNMALIHLQRAVDEGWRQYWRPNVEPALEDLVKEPAFAAMMQGLATRMQLIREQIEFDEAFDKDWKS